MPICDFCETNHESAVYCAATYLTTADQVQAVPDDVIGPILRAHRAPFAAALHAWAERGDQGHKVLDTARWLYGLDRRQ
jgi:hypothetical protein